MSIYGRYSGTARDLDDGGRHQATTELLRERGRTFLKSGFVDDLVPDR